MQRKVLLDGKEVSFSAVPDGVYMNTDGTEVSIVSHATLVDFEQMVTSLMGNIVFNIDMFDKDTGATSFNRHIYDYRARLAAMYAVARTNIIPVCKLTRTLLGITLYQAKCLVESFIKAYERGEYADAPNDIPF